MTQFLQQINSLKRGGGAEEKEQLLMERPVSQVQYGVLPGALIQTIAAKCKAIFETIRES